MKYPLKPRQSDICSNHSLKMRDINSFISDKMGNSRIAANNYAFEQTNGRCIYCGRKLYVLRHDEYELSRDATFDHLIPVSCFGLYEQGNIALACQDCNARRGNTTPEAFYKILYDKQAPVYFDTFRQFEASLKTLFYDKYKENNPRFFELGYNMLYNSSSDLQVTLHVQNTSKQITDEVVIPVYNLNNNDIDPNVNQFQLFRNHLERISSIRNPSKLSKFKYAVNTWFQILRDNGIADPMQIANLTQTDLNKLAQQVKHSTSASPRRVMQVLRLSKISFGLPMLKGEQTLQNVVRQRNKGDVLFEAHMED